MSIERTLAHKSGFLNSIEGRRRIFKIVKISAARALIDDLGLALVDFLAVILCRHAAVSGLCRHAAFKRLHGSKIKGDWALNQGTNP